MRKKRPNQSNPAKWNHRTASPKFASDYFWQFLYANPIHFGNFPFWS
jgi:hypothetical protein